MRLRSPRSSGATRCLTGSASTIIYYPVSGIMWLWYKLFALHPRARQLLRLGAVGDVPGLHACARCSTSRSSSRSGPPGRCRNCSRRSRRCRRSTARTASAWRWRCRSCRREHGFNPILGCLPMLAQIPVFLGLYHVLLSFNRTQSGFGRLGLSVEENRVARQLRLQRRPTSAHFLDANLFGAPIGASMTQQHGLDAFTEFSRPAVIGGRRPADDRWPASPPTSTAGRRSRARARRRRPTRRPR